jgi:hypothetical protein
MSRTTDAWLFPYEDPLQGVVPEPPVPPEELQAYFDEKQRGRSWAEFLEAKLVFPTLTWESFCHPKFLQAGEDDGCH